MARGTFLSVALVSLLLPCVAGADQEVSNLSQVTSSPDGRCYARSGPAHLYDPDGRRQEGRTLVFRVEEERDVLLDRYAWFSQRLLVHCRPGDPSEATVVRLGPWQRGCEPQAGHLALAFYRGGALVKSYATLDIAGPVRGGGQCRSERPGVSASVSHYQVFATPPRMTRHIANEGASSSKPSSSRRRRSMDGA